MSAEAVRSAAQRFVCDCPLGGVARSDVVAALFAVDRAALQFFYDLAHDAGLASTQLYGRTVAVAFEYAAVQLADDLADGDGAYLENFQQTGPGVAWGLQLLFMLACKRAALSFDVVGDAAGLLLQMLDGQQRDVRTQSWDLQSSLAAARMNELQYAAYFSLLLQDTAHERDANEWGRRFGISLHAVGDLKSRDARLVTLLPSEQRNFIERALSAASELRASTLPVVAKHGRHFEARLRAYRAHSGETQR